MSKALVAAGSLFVSIFAMAYAFGCNSSDESGGSSGDRLATEGEGGDFCNRTVGIVAGALETCCNATDQATQDYALVRGITNSIAPACTRALERSITKQRVRIRPTEAESCYRAYADRLGGSANCPNLTTTYAEPSGASCRNAFSGTQAAGALCGGDQECESGLTCVGYTSSSDGVCQPPPPVDAPCGPGASDGGSSDSAILAFGAHPACATGAYCSNGKCTARVPSGGKCLISDDATTECAEGLHCHLGVCGTEGRAGAGGACRVRDDCNAGYYCAVTAGAQSGQCTELKTAGGTCRGFSGSSECKGRCQAEGGAAGTCVTFCGSQ